MGVCDMKRIKEVIQRAQRGQELTIAFLGGSITQGSLASRHENTYAYRVYRWWRETFPQTKFHYVNGGIGGTDSYYGVSRAVTDVLMYQPDFVVVDFSVNDVDNIYCEETFEGVIRKLLSWKSTPAVLILNNVFYDSGENTQDIHNKIADYYGIPHVSIRDSVFREIEAGVYDRNDITPDGLHPNDKGHGLVAGEIIKTLEEIAAGMEENEDLDSRDETDCKCILPASVTVNAYESAKRLTIREICPKLHGFRADTEEKMGHLDHFKNGWIGVNAGDKITFALSGSCIGIQYRKTISRPAVRAEAVIDGDTNNPILLDGNFDQDWGDCLYIQPVLHHSENTRHTLEITVIDDECVGTTPFYLMAIIVA